MISDLIEKAFEIIRQLAECHDKRLGRGACDQATYDNLAAAAARLIKEAKKYAESLPDRPENYVDDAIAIDLGGSRIIVAPADPSGCWNSGGYCQPLFLVYRKTA